MPQSRPGEVILQSNKILIYQEFPSFGPLIRSVCALLKFSCSIFSVNQVFGFYNIPHLFIDGDMGYEARAKITSKFTCDPSIRVLFFSSVGAIGLNLSVANIVVFLVCYAVHHTRTSYSDPVFRTSLGVLRMSYKFKVVPTVNHRKKMFIATTCLRMEHQMLFFLRWPVVKGTCWKHFSSNVKGKVGLFL
jgi:hypothetical protein